MKAYFPDLAFAHLPVAALFGHRGSWIINKDLKTHRNLSLLKDNGFEQPKTGCTISGGGGISVHETSGAETISGMYTYCSLSWVYPDLVSNHLVTKDAKKALLFSLIAETMKTSFKYAERKLNIYRPCRWKTEKFAPRLWVQTASSNPLADQRVSHRYYGTIILENSCLCVVRLVDVFSGYSFGLVNGNL